MRRFPYWDPDRKGRHNCRFVRRRNRRRLLIIGRRAHAFSIADLADCVCLAGCVGADYRRSSVGKISESCLLLRVTVEVGEKSQARLKFQAEDRSFMYFLKDRYGVRLPSDRETL